MSKKHTAMNVLFIIILVLNFITPGGPNSVTPVQAAENAAPLLQTGCPCSIWLDVVPQAASHANATPIEMGLKFQSSVAGKITGVRFYKVATATGTHIGRLWTTDGIKLAEVTFTNEGASGWQAAYFSTPVDILPDTTYIISYYVGDGNRLFAYSQNYFTNSGVANYPLTALQAGVAGPNGVYNDDGVGFFDQSYNSSNYWVDVIFDDTPDTTPPTVNSVVPAAGATSVLASTNVTAEFSEAMAPLSLTNNFELRDPSNELVPASISYNAASRAAVLNPISNLSFSTSYTATLKGGDGGVTDVAGNPLAEDYTWSFTVEASDTTPPTVVVVIPINGATEIAASTNVTATFSEALDPSTINTTNFELRDSYTNLVSASVTYNAETFSILLDPTEDLIFGGTYTARITGVTDLAGNPLQSDYSWTFTIASLPIVSSISPAAGAIEVIIGSNVTATFSKAMNLSTITTTNFELTSASENPVPASVSYDSGSFTATLNPNSDLAYSTTYTATIKGGATGVKDLAGYPLALDYSWAFTTEPLDTTPPTVTSVKPIDGASRLRLATNATAYFSRAMDPITINDVTIEMRDNENNLVSSTITYNSVDNSVTVDPDSALSYSTTYSVRVKGGVEGVKDANGIPVAADYSWVFSTLAPRPPVDQAPGGPILIITSSGNLYTRYYTEILRTEGLNEFSTADILTVTGNTLDAYDLVVLGEMPLSSDQVAMFTTWVEAGGHLIAMRPDKQLAGLLGLTDASSTVAEGYLLFDTSQSPGAGIVNQTLQFHGTADGYTVSGATSLATLYSDISTSTSYPAVTLHSVGSGGGLAAAFTFDLARSIIFTHQGNPAWQINHPASPQSYGTALDLFYPDWIDFDRISIPQADEQQRFLANLILHMNADKKPLPRFWYFPNGEKAVIILTGDDHWGRATPSGSSQQFFDRHISQSPAGCSVEDWECVRSSSYGYPGALLTDAQAAAYAAQGFEFGVHADAGLASGGGWCGTWPVDMPAKYAEQFEAVYTKYASIPVQGSERSHCYSWFGYTGAEGWNGYAGEPQVEADLGIRLDTNISYNPASWASVNPGYQMGSGMMMRFAQVDLNGTMVDFLDIYNAGTQMTDDNGQGAAAMRTIVDSYLAAALGPQGYYGGFVVNMHSDNWYGWSYTGSDQVVASAQAYGIPVVSGRQMVDWLDGRNSSSFNSITWNGTIMGFSVDAGVNARNLQAMIPARVGIIPLGEIRLDGTTIVPFTLQTIKGVEYAFFSAVDGSYAATYTPDETPPTISSVVANPTTGGSATINWTTDEPTTSKVDYGIDADLLTLSMSEDALVTEHTINLSALSPNTLYYYRVSSTDGSGNTAVFPINAEPPATFTTPSAAFIDTTVSDFSMGTPDTNIYISQVTDGELILSPLFAAEFSGTSLPADWFHSGSGAATVNGGVLTVDGYTTGPGDTYSPGHSLEAIATFGGAVFQHLGFGVNLSAGTGDAWAIISTGASGSGLFARSWNGSGSWTTETSTAITGSYFGAPHRYRIAWGTETIDYYVDGVNVATHNLAITTSMRPLVADSTAGGASVSADWIQLSPYAGSGSFISRVFDSQGDVSSGTIDWDADIPEGTSLVISLRSGNSATPDESWSAFTPVNPGDAIGSGFRYIQYRGEIATTDVNQSPSLQQVAILYNKTDDTIPPTVTNRSPGDNEASVAVDTDIIVQFSEPMKSITINSSSFRLRAEGALSDMPAVVTTEGLRAILNPNSSLSLGTLYNVILASSIEDMSGNALGQDIVWSFTTGTSSSMMDDTIADFSAGSPDENTYITETDDGEVILAPDVGIEFSGTSLPTGWETTTFATGGSAIVNHSVLTLDGARVGTTQLYSPGVSVEGVVTFASTRFQHFGFAVTYSLDGTPWAIISTGADGAGLYARTYTGTGTWDTQSSLLAGNYFDVPHRYRVDWRSDHIDYYVDGELKATHNIAISTPMRPMPADSDVGGDSLIVDWMHMSPYAETGTFTSRIFDAGQYVDWTDLPAATIIPSGTISIETRTSVDGSLWSDWAPLSGINIVSPSARYIQYKTNLSTSDPHVTPVVESVTINYIASANQAPVASPQSLTIVESVATPITLSATDPDGNPLVYTIVTGPAHGTLSGTPPAVTYTPSAGFVGLDSFSFVASDGLASDEANVTIIVISDLIFADGFESGDFSRWTSAVTGGSDLSVSTAAALFGSNGLQAVINDNTPIFVRDETPLNEAHYRTRFYFNPNGISMADGDTHAIFIANNASTGILQIDLRRSNGVYQVRAYTLTDTGSWRFTSFFTISDAWSYIELDWKAATAMGANDGSLTLWIDGLQRSQLISLDNDTRRIERAALGPLQGIDTTTRGTYFFDAFESRRVSYVGLEADFTASPTSGAAPLTVNFTSLAAPKDNDTTYLWDFGEGVTSPDPDPSYVYNIPGTYTVSLTVSRYGDSFTVTKTAYIDVINLVPVSLTIIQPTGGLITADPEGPYTYGDVVTLEAEANTNYAFTGWTGDLSGTTNPTTIMLNGDRTVGATFVYDPIFADGFESGDFSRWTSAVTGGSDLSVSTAAALFGSNGLQAVINDNTPIFVRDETPLNEAHYRTRFYFNPNGISMADGDTHAIFIANNASTGILQIDLRRSNGVYQVRAYTLTDTGSWRFTSFFTISDAWSYIELDWKAATAMGANDGSLTLWIDGLQRSQLISLDNDTRRIERAALGPLQGIDTTTRGTYFFDAFESRRVSYVGLEADFTASPTSGAAPLTVNFTSLAAPKDNDTTYLWDFGEGVTSPDPDPSYVYNIPGTYTVSLTVSRYGDSFTVTKTAYIDVINLVPVSLTIIQPTGGLITADPEGPYTYGDVVTLEAEANTNYAFTGWTGDLSGTTNPTTIMLNGDRTVGATFVYDPIFADGFESGDFSRWTSAVTGGSDLSVSTAAALFGSNGLQAVINDNTPIFVRDETPLNEAHYRTRFYFNPNGISMADGDTHAIFIANNASTGILQIDLRRSNGAYQVRAYTLTDTGSWRFTSFFTISDAWSYIELDWKAATAMGANDGSLTLWIDGLQRSQLISLDNDTRRIERAALGPLQGIDTTTRGTYFFDAFESRRVSYVGQLALP